MPKHKGLRNTAITLGLLAAFGAVALLNNSNNDNTPPGKNTPQVPAPERGQPQIPFATWAEINDARIVNLEGQGNTAKIRIEFSGTSKLTGQPYKKTYTLGCPLIGELGENPTDLEMQVSGEGLVRFDFSAQGGRAFGEKVYRQLIERQHICPPPPPKQPQSGASVVSLPQAHLGMS